MIYQIRTGTWRLCPVWIVDASNTWANILLSNFTVRNFPCSSISNVNVLNSPQKHWGFHRKQTYRPIRRRVLTVTTFGGGHHCKFLTVRNAKWTGSSNSCNVRLWTLSNNTLEASTHNHFHVGSVVSNIDHVQRNKSFMLLHYVQQEVAAFEIIVDRGSTQVPCIYISSSNTTNYPLITLCNQ